MLSMFLQSKWSCSVNTGLICRGARLGYINLNLAAVPQRPDVDKTDGGERRTVTVTPGGHKKP